MVFRFQHIPATAAAFIAAAATGYAQTETPPQAPAVRAPAEARPATDRASALEVENADLREKVRVIGEALAASNAEAAGHREEADRLRLQMEALGMAAVKGDQRAVQERLIAAMNDLRLCEEDKQELSERLVRLSEAALAFAAAPDAAARQNLDTEIANASKSVGRTQKTEAAPAVAVENSKVVSLLRDIGFAVINAGSEGGVRMGMPVRVLRDDKQIAGGIIIDLRDRVAGVLLTNAGNAGAEVGDEVRPDVTNSKQ